MKKTKQFITILLVMILLCGCGGKKTNVQKTKESETVQTVVEQDASESIDGFQKPDYEKFNSYASDNGLGGTPIYIEGKVLNQTKLGDSTSPVLALVVEQEDGKRWCVSLTFDSELEGIKEKNVRVFGSYQGYSDVMNLPAMIVAIEDSELMDKARIEIKENGEYKTVWSFMDYAGSESEKEKSSVESEGEEEGLNVIYSEKYKVDGEDIGIVLSEKDGTLDISIIGNAMTEEKASIMLVTFLDQLSKLPIDKYSINVLCGHLFVMYSIESDGRKTISGTNKDGSFAFSSAPDWLVTEFTMPEDEINDFVTELTNTLKDFGQNLGSKSKEQQEEATISQENETEEDRETLARKTYSYDDGSETTFLFSKDKENKFHLTISLNIDEKWKAAYAFTILCNTIQIDELKEVNAVVILQCGNDTLTSSGLSVDSSGNLIKNSEWLSEGITSEEFDEEEAELLIDNMQDGISDFIMNEMGKYLL